MADEVTCGVAGCGRAFLPGHGARGGDNPRCSMHLRREMRGHSSELDPNPLRTGDRQVRITVHTTNEVAGMLAQLANARGRSLSETAHATLARALGVLK